MDRGLTRRQFLIRTSALGLSIPLGQALAACTPSGSTSNEQKVGGAFRIGHLSGVDSLNPFVSQSPITLVTSTLVYPVLVSQTTAGSPIVGDFASSWTASADSSVYTFRTRTGGTWSDGRPVTAHDAAFTLNTLVKYKNGPAGLLSIYVTGIVKAEAKDDSTLVVTYEGPSPAGLSWLAFQPIFPEHVWGPAAQGDGSGLLSVVVDETAVCGGPFRYQRFQKNQVIIMQRHPGAYSRHPIVDEIGLVYQSSMAGMFQSLKGNEVDALDTGIEVPLGLDTLPKSDFNVEYVRSANFWEFGFNCSNQKQRHRELLDPRVREALAHAIDKDRIVAELLFGHGKPGSSIIGSEYYGAFSDPSIATEGFDIGLANSLLDGLGYKRGSDGIRVAMGEPMHYTLNISTDITAHDRLAQVISDGWAQIGVRVDGKPLDATGMIAATSGAAAHRTLDMFVWYWSVYPDPSFLLGVLTSAQIGGLSDSSYSNPQYDALYDQQAKEVNLQKRQAIVREMQQIVYRDKPYIVLCYPDAWSASSTRFTGLSLSGYGAFPPMTRDWAYDVKQA